MSAHSIVRPNFSRRATCSPRSTCLGCTWITERATRIEIARSVSFIRLGRQKGVARDIDNRLVTAIVAEAAPNVIPSPRKRYGVEDAFVTLYVPPVI
ncbi:MAG: hypothetical protein JO122_15015 [Acetobacteraceae bacterium]|nr:hypothetical protein [Acetobacteraceae bacterium]